MEDLLVLNKVIIGVGFGSNGQHLLQALCY